MAYSIAHVQFCVLIKFCAHRSAEPNFSKLQKTQQAPKTAPLLVLTCLHKRRAAYKWLTRYNDRTLAKTINHAFHEAPPEAQGLSMTYRIKQKFRSQW